MKLWKVTYERSGWDYLLLYRNVGRRLFAIIQIERYLQQLSSIHHLQDLLDIFARPSFFNTLLGRWWSSEVWMFDNKECFSNPTYNKEIWPPTSKKQTFQSCFDTSTKIFLKQFFITCNLLCNKFDFFYPFPMVKHLRKNLTLK